VEPLVVSLDDPSACDPALAGGKGAGLARMRQAGLPVPAGFVVTAAAHPSATAARGSAPMRAGTRFRGELATALRTLPRGVSLAVRSSAEAEDSQDLSYAGIYASFLNVRGTRDVLRRVAEVWASADGPAARSYRAQHSLEEAPVRMAVVVQQLVPADAAGIAFTVDPVTGSAERVLIEATLGLGEGLASGSTSADFFALDAGSGEIVERRVATKASRLAATSKGGVATREVGVTLRDRPALADRELAEVGRLVAAVRELFGDHRDIEFAVASGAVSLLQARPVTALAPSPAEAPSIVLSPADDRHAWVPLPMLGAAVPRLLEDVATSYVEASRRCFEETGAPRARFHVLGRFDGLLYARSPRVAEKEVRSRLQRHQRREARLRAAGSSLYAAEIEPHARAAYRRVNRFAELRGAGLEERVAHLETAIAEHAEVIGDLHWRLVSLTTLDWPSAFQRVTGDPATEAGVLLQAIDNRTMQLIRRVRGLAALARGDATLGAMVRAADVEALAQPSPNARPAVRRFRGRLLRLLRDFGTRSGTGFGSAIGPLDPTWNMRPAALLELVASYAEHDPVALARMEGAARRERNAARRRVRRGLAASPARLGRFDALYARAVDQVRVTENHNHLMEQGVAGGLREAIALVGEELAEQRTLGAATDVVHLSLAELQRLARGKPIERLPDLVSERRREYERVSHLEAPRRLGSGAPPPEPPRPGTAPETGAGRHGDRLMGTAASGGRQVSIARVALPGAPRPVLHGGEILVARNAGPDWTPVLPLLGGLVLDEGATFQHAALVAREYRIPAVVQTREATRFVRDGQRIAVDGTAGVVELAPSE